MATDLSNLIARLGGAPRLTADDALAARRAVFGGDVAVSPDEAEALIALDESAAERAPEWTDAFVEALVDYVVHQQAPRDYIDEAKADWLIARFSKDGRINTDSELEALVRMLELATSAPARLTAFTLDQVKRAVIDGEGPLLRAGALEKGRISAGEVALLRRILYAAGGDANVAITRAEAEVLFDINDACRGANNDPAWIDLFAKALAASVMTISGYTPADRETAARREAWLARPEPGGVAGVAGFLSRMFDGQARRSADPLDEWAAQNASEEAGMAAAETISADEAAWLAERIGRDGAYDEAERALIDFLKRESPSIHPALQGLLNAA